MRRILAITILLSSTLAIAQAQEEPTENDDWLIEGKRLISQERLPEAIEVFSQRKQQVPTDSRAYFYSGMAQAQMGNLQLAAADLKEAVRLEPKNFSYLILFANVLVRLEHDELALEVLARFSERWDKEPLPPAWLWVLSETYIRAGDNLAGLEILDILGQLDPENYLVDLNRGQVYFKQGDYEKALESVDASISRESGFNPAAYFYRGKILNQLGDAEGAKQAFIEAIGQDPENAEYLWKLGSVCLALGDNEEAVEYLERALPGADEFPEIYYNLGRAYQATKNQAKARATLKKFQTLTKSGRQKEYLEIRSAELVGKGEDAMDRGDPVEAQRLFELAVEENPENWSAHGYLAELALNSGSLYEAYPHLKKMEEIDPDSTTGHYLMARYWYARCDYQRSCKYAEKVKKVRPSNSTLRNMLGNIYLSLGRVPEAVQEYTSAVELAPDRPEFQRNLETARKQLP
ncbi:MAG: tetratricopeptide repeat protein [bacterium]